MKVMKVINAVIVGGGILMSLGANAANKSGGFINFKGSVINAPCGITSESAEQSVDFGQISKAHLDASGISVKKNLDIKLVNCDATELGKTGSVKVSFTGPVVKGQNQELSTAGNTGVAVVISGPNGGLVSFDGAADSAIKLQSGDNTLRYSTWVKKATSGALLEGDFTAVASFNLNYE